MDVQGEYTFQAPRELVWNALQDPDVLGSVMPGGQGFAQVGENAYAGELQIRVGPVQGVFSGNIQLSDIVELEGYTMDVDGKGAPGFVKANGSMQLTSLDNGHTFMTYTGTARIGGRIASVGQRLLDSSAKSIIRQSLEGLDEYLQVQMAAQQAAMAAGATAAGATAAEAAEAAAKAEMPVYKPPSQTEVAMNVARDVAEDLVPPQYRPLVIGGVVLAVLIVLYMLLRRK